VAVSATTGSSLPGKAGSKSKFPFVPIHIRPTPHVGHSPYRYRGAASGSLSTVALILAVTPVLAQTASQITPPTFRQELPRVGGAIVFSGRPGLEAPAGAERLFVRLKGVTIEGGLPELAAEQRAFEARFVGRRVPASEIFQAAQELEAAYARTGFVLVRIVVPAQTLVDGGRLRLTVVNGFIERAEVKGVPDLVRSRISAVVEPLIGKRGLRLAEIERRLLIAGDTPGVALRSALSPGSSPGGTVLVVEAKHKPLSIYSGFDNTFATDLGRSNLSASLDANSVLGFGEVFYLRASGHPSGSDARGLGGLFDDHPRVRLLAGGTVIPIGIDGMTLNLEGTESRTTPKAPAFAQTASVFDRFSTRLRYPWIRSRSFNVGTEAIFDVQSEDLDLLIPGGELPLSRDRLRILRLAGDTGWLTNWNAVMGGRLIASFGLDAFGARSAADATPLLPLSRLGADADFQKLEAIVSYAQPVAENLAIALYARGQTSFNQALPRSEQIGIASLFELSTFDAGTLGGDSGWIVRGEVQSPWNVTAGGFPLSATPYAFAATGRLYLERPTILEEANVQVSSLGLGLRLAATIDPGFSFASLALEFGRRFRDDGLPDGNRFTVVGAIRF
jgi:hemolysin activation/secretion protein